MTTRTTAEAKLLTKAAKIVNADVDITFLIDGYPCHTEPFIGRCIHWLMSHTADSQYELAIRNHRSSWTVVWWDGVSGDRSLHIALAKAVIAVSKEEKSHEVPMSDRR